ncbi:MAG: hypothetical protein ACTSPP_08080 [Candidatus Heimdallarchaeaceae archaeon]
MILEDFKQDLGFQSTEEVYNWIITIAGEVEITIDGDYVIFGKRNQIIEAMIDKLENVFNGLKSTESHKKGKKL